jgi:hypothetical protein
MMRMRMQRKPLALFLVGFSKGLAFQSRMARHLVKANLAVLPHALAGLVLVTERSGRL